MICLKTKLHADVKLKTIFLEYGDPDVISSYTREKITSFSAVQKFDPLKCPVYFKLPWIGNTFLKFESQIKQAITKCFFAVNLSILVLYTVLGEPFHLLKKTPTTKKSSFVYEFTCKCDSGYVGPTTQRLWDRIKQHVPSNTRNKTALQREQPPQLQGLKNTAKTSDSAIGHHLLDNSDCAKFYNDNMFQTIGRAWPSFHLAALELIYIQTKKLPLCRGEFVFSL